MEAQSNSKVVTAQAPGPQENPGRSDTLEEAQLAVTLGATADPATSTEALQALAPVVAAVPSDGESEGSQHGPYVVGDYFMGFEFQVLWDQAGPGTTWVPGRRQGEYRLVPLTQSGNFEPQP